MAQEKSEVFTLVQTVNPSSDGVLHQNGYVGVDPVYQNHASDTEKPLAATKGDEKALEQKAKDRLDGKGNVANVQLAEIVKGRPQSQPAGTTAAAEAQQEASSGDETPSSSPSTKGPEDNK